MTRPLPLLLGLLAFSPAVPAPAQATPSFATLAASKDVQIPDWGPFSKQFAGVSHVIGNGDRFDFTVMLAEGGKKPLAPDVLTATGFHPWQASGDYRFFSHGMNIDGDTLFANVSFVPFGDNARLVRVEITNRSRQPRKVDLLSLANIAPEPRRVKAPSFTRSFGVWTNAADYSEIFFSKPSHDDHLVYDGRKPGELFRDHWIDSRALDGRWGRAAGDRVRYEITLDENFENAAAWIRYGNTSKTAGRVQAAGLLNQEIAFASTGNDRGVLVVPLGRLTAGTHALSLTVKVAANIAINGMLIAEASEVPQIKLSPALRKDKPDIRQTEAGGVIIDYAQRKTFYGIAWDKPLTRTRIVNGADSGALFERPIQPSFGKLLRSRRNLIDEDKIKYIASDASVEIPADTTISVHGVVCNGRDERAVGSTLDAFAKADEGGLEKLWRLEKSRSLRNRSVLPAAKPYLHGEQLMTATTLMNIVYPERVDGAWIKHYTPGKEWNSLYTWDSGFIGIGLASISRDRSIETLNTYVNGPEHHSAFVHHGTPLPIQIYQFMEIWNRNPDPGLLDYFYPRLKRFYRFFAGHDEGSTTAALKSGMLKTWDYFYNSGGWDDYPPQKYLTGKPSLRKNTAPVVSTATALRAAKILRTLAEFSGLRDDVAGYDRDIDTFTNALQTHAWDAKSGYFGYVTHDDAGRATGILRHESGENFDMGLDGLYPLVSGICTPKQRATLIGHLFNPKQIWTPCGLSTVDQSASYFSLNGYWNGSVWFPHQWVFWKAMLDLGEPDLAFRIANTALDNWRRLTTATNNCYELIHIKDGKGAGCSHFSGLSAPVLNWFDAYYRAGSLTGGFDAVITRRVFSENHDSLEADISFGKPVETSRALIVTLAPGCKYEARWNNQPIATTSPHDGCLILKIPGAETKGKLTIKPEGIL